MAMGVAFPSASFAGPTPSPPATSNIEISAANYKTARAMFKVEVKSREQIRNEINQIFVQAVNEANRKAKTSLKLAKNASAKREILQQQENAILLAIKIQAASIIAMGDALVLLDNPNQGAEAQGGQGVKGEKKDSEPTKKAKPKK